MAAANPDLYHLVFDTPAPDYTPSEFVIEITRTMLMRVRWMVASISDMDAEHSSGSAGGPPFHSHG